MGILGLLQYLKGCMKEKRLSEYRGKTVAVDSYAWLHKVIKGPSGRELIIGGPNKHRYINDCMNRIYKLRNNGIKVIMVFDGGPLPCKRQQEEQRKKRREETFARGKEMLEKGDEAGFKKLVDSIDISPDIAYQLILELKKKDIQYIVAPYEADAQLAYLSREDIVDYIITEDSDLLAFGAKRVLYKVDFTNMTVNQLELDYLPQSKEVNFTWFTHGMFLTTCILSGCDYLSSLSGVGFKTSHKSIARVTTFRGFLGQIANKSQIPPDYEINFMKAFLTFRFQRVYCPIRKSCVQLNDFRFLNVTLQDLIEQQKKTTPWSEQVMTSQVLEYVIMNKLDFSFLGEKYSDSTATNIANAVINPVTFIQYDLDYFQKLTYITDVNLITNSMISNLNRTNARNNKNQNNKPFSQQAVSMNKFLRREESKKQRLVPSTLQFKSIKNNRSENLQLGAQRQSNDEQYTLKPIKGGLRLCEDDEDESVGDHSAVVSYLESASVEQISNNEEEIQKNEGSWGESFEATSERFFNAFFSQEFLKNPFSM